MSSVHGTLMTRRRVMIERHILKRREKRLGRLRSGACGSPRRLPLLPGPLLWLYRSEDSTTSQAQTSRAFQALRETCLYELITRCGMGMVS
jgi:hypothetical protein